MKICQRPILKVVSIYLLINYLGTICWPTVAFALTSGPSSPEFSSFTPVGTTELVNTFTGDFSYNLPIIEVPGPHGSGYSMMLAYNSGINAEQEASWVGFGWTLNPGCISRNLRGVPDDYNGKEITYYNKSRPNWTATASTTAGLEAFSVDASLALNVGMMHRINNYSGYQGSKSLGVNFNGCVGFDATKDVNGTTFRPYVSPLGLYNAITKKRETYPGKSEKEIPELKNKGAVANRNRSCKISAQKDGYGKPTVGVGNLNLNLNNYGISLVPPTPKPFNYPSYSGFSLNWTVSMQFNPIQIPVGIGAGKGGTFSFRCNEPEESISAYGYHHTPYLGGSGVIMDYNVEKNRPFTPANIFIGIPQSNYDVFSVTGEGVGGGIRSFAPYVGHYSPSQPQSNTNQFQIGYEVMLGFNAGAGLDFGIGTEETKVDSWGKTNKDELKEQTSEFRFNNDMGGEVLYDDNTNVRQAQVSGDQALCKSQYNRTISGSSSRVKGITTGDSKLSGMEIVNKDGMHLYYDEPVMVRNESSVSVDVPRGRFVKNRFIAFSDIELQQKGKDFKMKDVKSKTHRTIVGQIDNNEYATNFLLTKIVDPSYIDADCDSKLSDDDFGGWTKFSYRSVYGGNRPWYRYRMPYNGLMYQQNAISDVKDDLGTVETGEKEVKYLHTIETPTHIAYFVTNKTENQNPYLKGSMQERKDGVGACPLTDTGADPASNSVSHGTAKLEYLEKIVLFAKKRDGNGTSHEGQKPLKIVRFEYDYSLVPNVANNINSRFNYQGNQNAEASESGKLTLRKVWVEYEGVVTARINPYIFDYHYPIVKSESKLATYFDDQYKKLTDDVQNPVYAPYGMDAWGNISPNGDKRKANGNVWTDQSAFLDERLIFDPAAYQLKAIRLPSGGKIYVQYESKDYAFVQNRDAMAMARVRLPDGQSGPSYDEDGYFVSVEDLGVNALNEADVDALVLKMKQHFLSKKASSGTETFHRKIYYKFLFSLLGGTPSLDNPLSEYITGYADVKSVEKVVISDLSGGGKKYGVKINIGENKGSDSFTPRMACWEFVANQRQGKVRSGDGIEPYYEALYDNAMEDAAYAEDAGDVLKYGVIVPMLTEMAIGIGVNSYKNFDKKDPSIGQNINPELSFLKLPVLNRKIGGGVRVKRLLMHDSGIEQGDEVIMGSEYQYTMEDGITSSGVATNEPGGAREENPLVDFIPEKDGAWWEKLIAGEMIDQTEGPIGESFLPGASIGYRRVVVENIHKGVTGNGYSVNEYYTVHDYPFDKYYERSDEGYDFKGSANQMTDMSENTFDFSFMAGLFNYVSAKQWVAQGFRFVQTAMHGLPKKIATYSGSYAESFKPGSTSYLVSGQEYEYFEPGEKVKVVCFNEKDELSTYDVYPGKEMDMAREAKRITDTALDFSVEVDISVAVSFLPLIFVGVWPSFSLNENEIATHATTKVISYPAILKRVTSTVEGIASTTENLAFDKNTGDAILLRNSDSYKGAPAISGGVINSDVYTLNIPVSWVYKEMGPIVIDGVVNENALNQLNAKFATFVVHNVEPDAEWLKSPHDLLSAVITTYKDKWGDLFMGNAKIMDDYQISSKDEADKQVIKEKMNEKWLPGSSYVFNTDLKKENKVFRQGKFDVKEINWQSKDWGNSWLKSNEVMLYSLNSVPVCEQDILGIPSSAYFGKQYRYNVPSMVSNNSDYVSMYFEDFESVGVKSVVSHSGNGSKSVGALVNLLPGVKVTSLLQQQGAMVRFWMNGKVDDLKLSMSGVGASGVSNTNLISTEIIASVDGWVLYQAIIGQKEFATDLNASTGNSASDLSVSLSSESSSHLDGLFIDDVRFQPLNAASTCYVYNPENMRLVVQFDDQHFGTYYQYNQEGQLVRKIVETERGKQTLQEMNYNVPSEYRVAK